MCIRARCIAPSISWRPKRKTGKEAIPMGKVVHRGYSATERQIGAIYNGYRIVERREIPAWKRNLLYGGKRWEFIGERVSERGTR